MREAATISEPYKRCRLDEHTRLEHLQRFNSRIACRQRRCSYKGITGSPTQAMASSASGRRQVPNPHMTEVPPERYSPSHHAAGAARSKTMRSNHILDMWMQVLFVEVGFGCDGHGQNVTVSCSQLSSMKCDSAMLTCKQSTHNATVGPSSNGAAF